MSAVSGVNGITKGLILGTVGVVFGGAGISYIAQRIIRDTINEQVHANNERHEGTPRSRHNVRKLATS